MIGMNKPTSTRAWACRIDGEYHPMLIGKTKEKAAKFARYHAAYMQQAYGKKPIVGKPERVVIVTEAKR